MADVSSQPFTSGTKASQVRPAPGDDTTGVAGATASDTTPVIPTGWEKFLAGEKVCPLCGCATFFLLGLFFLFVLLGYLGEKGDSVFSFEDADVKSDLIVQRAYAFEAARGEPIGCTDDAHQESKEVCEADEACKWDASQASGGGSRGGSEPKNCKDKELCPAPPPRDREYPLIYDGGPMWVGLIYEAEDGGNILDDEILEQIRKFEKSLLTDVNGATFRGKPSPWDEDWCRLTYPMGSQLPGRCAAPDSVLNLFAMTAEGRAATKAQVADGFAPNRALACMCTDEDELCSICTSDGGVKAELPPCMAALAAAPAATTTSTPGVNGTLDICSSAQSFSTTAFFTSFCATKPSCQWGPPKTSKVCYASSFYHPNHISGLVKGAEKELVLNKMCDETNEGWWQVRMSQLPLSFDCTSKSTSFARTSFFAGGSGDTTGAEGTTFEQEYVSGTSGWYVRETMLERDIEQASEGKLRVILFSAATLRSQFLNILLIDGLLSVVSLMSVWAYMWWSLESAFLAGVAMFEIIFSLPVTMFFWAVLGQQEILFTQMLCIYLILGIGADDAFILNDAWMQSRLAGPHISGDKTTRFAWAYRRAFKAMLVTTATTCGSFLIGAVSPLPQVQAFCIFAALVVLVDWLFCVTLFAAAVMVYDRYIRSDKDPGTCCGPGCCCGAVRVCSQAFCKSCVGDVPGPNDPPQKRAMERFCEGPLFNCLRRFKLPLIAVWAILVIAMLINAGVNLRTAEERSPIGKQSLDVIRGFEILLEEFSLFSTPTTSFVYGLDPEEPIEFGSTPDEDKALYSASEAAKLTTPEGQLELLSLCRAGDGPEGDVRCEDRSCLILGRGLQGSCPANTEVYRKTGVYMTDDVLCRTGRYCFMEEFARYWAFHIKGAACKDKATEPPCTQSGCAWDANYALCYPTTSGDDYPGLPAAEFVQHLASDGYAAYLETRSNTLRAYVREFDDIFERSLTGYRLNPAKTALQVAWVSFNATYPVQNTVEEANNWFDRWEAFRVRHTPSIGGYQTTDLYKFMVTQNEMVKAAVMGVLLSLLITFIIMLIATKNWRLSVLGLGNITSIACVFLGLIPAIGWSLGENECIFLIAVVGLSVDYSVHLLHAYTHSKQDDKEGRTQHALSEMGISVINSAATTLLAAAILFGCGFYFFIQFGGFVFMVIGLSILMSITFLIPLMLLLGPHGMQGDLSWMSRRCRRS